MTTCWRYKEQGGFVGLNRFDGFCPSEIGRTGLATASAGAECAEQNVGDRTVHGFAHEQRQQCAGGAHERSGDDHGNVVMVKPSAATARPVNEFNSEMTTGMSAPPMGMTIAIPKNSASKNIAMNAGIACGLVELDREPAAQADDDGEDEAVRMFCPGNVCGFSR